VSVLANETNIRMKKHNEKVLEFPLL